MSKNSGTLHPDVFDCKQAALELRTFSNAPARCAANLSDRRSFFHRRVVTRSGFDAPSATFRSDLSCGGVRNFHHDQALTQSPQCRSRIVEPWSGCCSILRSPSATVTLTDSIVVQGDLVQLLERVIRLMRMTKPEDWRRRLSSLWLQRIQANSITGSARNIHQHYDLTSDFYRLWLDSRLVYTCAYFPTPSTPLEQAQLAKMDYVCRKLQLQPGEEV